LVSGSLVDRLLAVVHVLADAPAGLPLHAIAAAIDVPKSAAHRLLADLVRNRYARQDSASGRYRLTMRIVSLGFRHLAATGVVDLAQPTLDALAESTGELVRLGIVDGDRQTWVAKAQGARHGLRYDPDMGMEAPLASTASGHAWLACLTDEEAVALVMKQGFGSDEARGPNAPRTVKALLERLAQSRRRGFSIVVESSAPGTSAMAAAIRHPAGGRVLGVVSIAGPSVRLTETRMRSLAPQLLEAARELAEACDGSAYLAHAAPASGHRATVAADRSR
jgi:IclR family acetate operon transcriptional repressor